MDEFPLLCILKPMEHYLIRVFGHTPDFISHMTMIVTAFFLVVLILLYGLNQFLTDHALNRKEGKNMKRYVDMKDISDGRLYSLNDMVKADCKDCTGCSACCHGMGNSIVLDPYDIWRLTEGMGVSLPELIAQDNVEINMADGVTLPNLKMQEETEACGFLDGEGRCSIHAFRPGICRLFPLGRYYEERSFRYFLQIHECQKENRSKVKVWKWIDTPDARRYDQYITDWHFHLAGLQEQVKEKLRQPEAMGEQKARNINMDMIQQFFLKPYEKDRDFYSQFYERLEASRMKWTDQQGAR